MFGAVTIVKRPGIHLERVQFFVVQFKILNRISRQASGCADVVPGTVFDSRVFGFGGNVVINGSTEVKAQYQRDGAESGGKDI